MINKKNFPGLDGFVWWTGIVEGRKDPLKLGRVQVRIFGWHTGIKQMIPSENLLWAQPIFPGNSSNETYCPKEGDAIFGFYIDGDSAQYPFYFGRFPDIPSQLYGEDDGFSDPGTNLDERPVKIKKRKLDKLKGYSYENKDPARYPDELNKPTTSKLARNEDLDQTPMQFIKDNLASGQGWEEPEPAYGAVYPYNDSKESESGHYFDIDDTKEKERISLMHRTGTYMEMRPDGGKVDKVLKDGYDIVHGMKVNYVGGKYILEVEGDWEVLVKGSISFTGQGN